MTVLRRLLIRSGTAFGPSLTDVVAYETVFRRLFIRSRSASIGTLFPTVEAFLAAVANFCHVSYWFLFQLFTYFMITNFRF